MPRRGTPEGLVLAVRRLSRAYFGVERSEDERALGVCQLIAMHEAGVSDGDLLEEVKMMEELLQKLQLEGMPRWSGRD